MGENLEVCFQIFMDNWKYEIGEIKIDEFLRNITIFIRHNFTNNLFWNKSAWLKRFE